MTKIQENSRDYHRRREADERARASAAKDPRIAHPHIVMAERHRLFALEELDETASEIRRIAERPGVGRTIADP